MQGLIKLASQTNDEIKIKVKEYKIHNPYDDKTKQRDTSTDFYESDDEEKGDTKKDKLAILKGTKSKSKEIELSKLNKDKVRSKSFKTNREMGY